MNPVCLCGQSMVAFRARARGDSFLRLLLFLSLRVAFRARARGDRIEEAERLGMEIVAFRARARGDSMRLSSFL